MSDKEQPTDQQQEDIDRLIDGGQVNPLQARERILGRTGLSAIGSRQRTMHRTIGRRGHRARLADDAARIPSHIAEQINPVVTSEDLPELTEESRQAAVKVAEQLGIQITSDTLADQPGGDLIQLETAWPEQMIAKSDRQILEAKLEILNCFASVARGLGYLNKTAEDSPDRLEIEAKYESRGAHVPLLVSAGVIGNMFKNENRAQETFLSTLPAELSDDDVKVAWRALHLNFAGINTENVERRKAARKEIKKTLQNMAREQEAA